MARNSPSSSKISIWWDIENCHVPRNVDPHYIAQNLRSALHHVNLNGPITIDIFGDTRNLEHKILEALSSTGVTINHIPSGNKDAADKAILVAMLFWALDNPPPAHFLLISGDGDFANALHRLRLKGYDILLARPDQPVKPALLGAATSVWYWTNVAKGQIAVAEEEKKPHEDSSGAQSRAFRLSTDEAVQNVSLRVTPLQETDGPGKVTSSKVSRAYHVKSEADSRCFGERHSSMRERDESPRVFAHSQVSDYHTNRSVIQENVKVIGDTTLLESNLQVKKVKPVSHSLISNAVNTSQQLYNLGPQATQSGLQFSKQSPNGHVSSNKINDFDTKGPPGISLPIPTVLGHLPGPSQDSQRAFNPNILMLMKIFEMLKLDGLVPTQENLQHCLCYWDKKNGKVNLTQVLEQALTLGHVEKVSVEEGFTYFLPAKTELWSCFDVGDMNHAFSDTLSKDFHQFLCCSKNWQFFVHSESMYEAGQRLKKDGPTGIKNLAVGEIIGFLNQAIWRWKWLSLENTPTFLLSIKSQAVFIQRPTEDFMSMPLKSSQPEKVVPTSVISRDNINSVYDTSTRRSILKKLKIWLKEIAESRLDYDVSLVPKDFERATGIYLDIQKLGFAKLQGLLEECSDVISIQVARKGLKVLCPAANTAQDKQQKRLLPASQEKQQKGILSTPDNNYFKQSVGMTRFGVSIQEQQGCTQPAKALSSCRSGSSVIVTSQHVGASHVGATQAYPERPVTRNHPLLRKLRSWLLQLPSLKHGYDISSIKKDFYQATGMVLDPPALGYLKVKDILKIFPEDFHLESPRQGLTLLFTNNESMLTTKSNTGSNCRNPAGESLEHMANKGVLSKPLELSAKNKTGSVQWKELNSSVKTVDGKTSRTVETTKEALVATVVSEQVLCSSLSLPDSQVSGNTELHTEKAEEPNCLTSSISQQ